MRKVVVTGGAGFIGSHLAEELTRRDHQVIILDDLSTGKKENIEPLLNKDNVEFIQGSVTDLSLLQKLLQDVHFVFHLAAIPSVPRSMENPLATHEVNATGTLKLLLAARDNRVSKVIYTSSSSVYGDTPTLPKKEEMPPNPQSPYAASKVAGEHYCQVFQRVYALPTVCLRYFNIYGPRQDVNSQYAAVIPAFLKRLCQGDPPIIYGDGEQTRDCTFVKDTVEANILAAESQLTGTFNVGTGERVSINELARLVIKLIGNSIEPVYKELRPGDVEHSLADISRAKAFGYAPRFSLEEGLKETIRSFRNETQP
ncbi:SDR family oxidoreductase [Chloroflexota bacterium]